MINLELSKAHAEASGQLKMVAEHMMRPYSRKYDREEHAEPVEMQEVAKILDGARPGGGVSGEREKKGATDGVKNGGNLMAVTAYESLCWGDVGLMLAMPGRGLGNAALAAVATPEQKRRRFRRTLPAG